jgi:hypothetical protein
MESPMLKLLLSPVQRKSPRSFHQIYRASFDSMLSASGKAYDSELQSFLAATTRKAGVPRKPGAFADTEWLCTQWPATGFDPQVL